MRQRSSCTLPHNTSVHPYGLQPSFCPLPPLFSPCANLPCSTDHSLPAVAVVVLAFSFSITCLPPLIPAHTPPSSPPVNPTSAILAHPPALYCLEAILTSEHTLPCSQSLNPQSTTKPKQDPLRASSGGCPMAAPVPACGHARQCAAAAHRQHSPLRPQPEKKQAAKELIFGTLFFILFFRFNINC